MVALSPRRTVWFILALGLSLRLLLSGHFLLAPDEANYWQWSRYLALGYYDHPPLIAWTIWLSTNLLGHTEFAVRLPTVLGISIASLYLCLLTAHWFSWTQAVQVALLSQALLLFNGAALIATPDGLLLPCWAAATYYAALALEKNTLRYWLYTGFCFGLGLLAKYTMLVFLGSFFLYLLCSPVHRPQLWSRKPWLGLFLGLLLFTPVLLWNAQNHWVTFRHVLFQGGVGSSPLITFSYLPEFLASQAALLSPLLFLLVLAAALQGWRTQPGDRISFLLWLFVPGLLIFTLLSLQVRIYGNWPAPIYLSALILVPVLYASYKRLWQATLGLALLFFALPLIHLSYPLLPIPVAWDRIAQETHGWKDLAQQVEQHLEKMDRPEQTFIFGLRYQYASQLAFYMQGQPRTLSINRWSRPNVYDFWFDDAEVLGMDGIGIFEHRGVDGLLTEVFERVEPAEEILLYRFSPWFGKEVLHTLYLSRCFGFKGGLRWQAKEEGDIRTIKQR